MGRLTTMRPTILLVGLGDLGGVVLDRLAGEEGFGRIVVASRNSTRGIARCNLARLSALAEGHSIPICFTPLDINDRKAVVRTVRREAPQIILLTATMQTWWLPDLLPPEQAARIKSAGFGVWLPVHMTLTMKFMEALQEMAYGGIILTAPFPDVVNCVMGRLGLAPTCGLGNVEEIVSKVRLLASERLEEPLESVHVILVAHHALQPAAFGEAFKEVPPHFLRVEVDGRDVTEQIRAEELLLAPYPVPPGRAIHSLTAGCTMSLVRALLSQDRKELHVPGPGGLPGGYPVLVSREGVEIAPIEGIGLEEAVAINERSHRFDGIERIEDDGTVVFCPEAVQILRTELGYDCRVLRPQEAEERALELIARFREYAGSYGVDLQLSGGAGHVF
ncbi:MAG: hypothetical protein JRH07_03845 [Deltaproteobacteria bacterium]|nr:hypothetical protein [Deltaproteobacteria bacterium]MBW2120963.1 hypothetical protein [Deltaproteobacteria bacterium]